MSKTFSITEDQMAILLDTFIKFGEAIASKSGVTPALAAQMQESFTVCETVVKQ
jgi:hypothetical protein